MDQGTRAVGFEAMPQIADLEIAATWDEIELEAALRSQSAQTPADIPSSLADTLRAVEALKQLPKEERKRRAEELLRALTSAPAAPSAVPQAETISSEPVASAESVVETPEIVEPVPAETPEVVEAAPAEPAVVETLELIERETTAATGPAAADAIPESVVLVEPVGAEPAAPAQEVHAVAESPAVQEPAPEGTESTAVVEPVPEIAESAAVAEAIPESSETGAVAEVVPESTETVAPAVHAAAVVESASPAAERAPETVAPPVAAPVAAAQEPDHIPRFLTTEYAAHEPDHPDVLIPFRTVAAAGALVGAALLVYFWSSQEFGVAARPILPASEMAQARHNVLPPSASLAARQAFVRTLPSYSEQLEASRLARPPFLGFDLDEASPEPTAAKVDTAAPPPPAAQPAAPAEASALPASAAVEMPLPPAVNSEAGALLKRGDDLLKAGDVVAARSAYERVAAAGNPKGAIGVGRTYDPLVLAKLGARGVRGDPVQAAAWYARAGEAGDEEGRQRLNALLTGLSDCMISQGTCASRKP